MKRATEHTYSEGDKPEGILLTEGAFINSSYDNIGRLGSRTINTGSAFYKTEYLYKAGIDGSTTEKVEKIDNNRKLTEYEYYPDGNIKEICVSYVNCNHNHFTTKFMFIRRVTYV